jgi:hypothetical protein
MKFLFLILFWTSAFAQKGELDVHFSFSSTTTYELVKTQKLGESKRAEDTGVAYKLADLETTIQARYLRYSKNLKPILTPNADVNYFFNNEKNKKMLEGEPPFLSIVKDPQSDNVKIIISSVGYFGTNNNFYEGVITDGNWSSYIAGKGDIEIDVDEKMDQTQAAKIMNDLIFPIFYEAFYQERELISLDTKLIEQNGELKGFLSTSENGKILNWQTPSGQYTYSNSIEFSQ